MAPIPADSAPQEPVEVVPEAVLDVPVDATDVADEATETTAEIAIAVSTPAPTVPPPAPVAAPPARHEPVELPTPVASGPATRVHAQRLVTASPKLQLTPSQAVRLASDGRDVLTRARPRAT